MAGLAYLLLPVSGLLAYFRGTAARVRFHGLQAILIGLVWPVVLILCSKLTPGATQIAFGAGTLVWLGFMVLTSAGRNPSLPFVGGPLKRAAEGDPTGGAEL
jgi:uncharacterized membrane protein